MIKPLIGIVLDSAINSDKYSYSDYPWYALKKKYPEAIVLAGGIPLMLHYDINLIDNYLDSIDGLVIPGGDEDINPRFYGEAITSNRVKVNDLRASFELKLTEVALKRNLPFLGICNGMQVLNVALGGSLLQHIPDVIESDINHEQPAPKHIPSHDIEVFWDSKLATLTDKLNLRVMSTHHQAIKNLGEGLIVSAKAPDGIIEGIESVNHDFAIGVEWHPEFLETMPLDLNLFKELVKSASKRSNLNFNKKDS